MPCPSRYHRTGMFDEGLGRPKALWIQHVTEALYERTCIRIDFHVPRIPYKDHTFMLKFREEYRNDYIYVYV